jgi:hypothetical protein
MKPPRLAALCLLLGLLPAPVHAEDRAGAVLVTAPAADDPAAVAVTEENLLSQERFWPYRVALTAPWPQGRLPAGMTGVLIRIEESGLPRIDFGRDGKHEVPVARTDLIERANRIRTGELAKPEPNFVHAIKSRMLDSASESLRRLPPGESEDREGFLCVFADPTSEEFGGMAAALASLGERREVLTILFPQGRHPDADVREKLRSLGWTVPFLHGFLAEPYTATLLEPGVPMPQVLLQTNEGRVLVQGPWKPDLAPALRAAMEATFGAAPAARAATPPQERDRL